MLNKQTKTELNVIIHNIKFYENKIERIESKEDLSPTDFDLERNNAINLLNYHLDEFNSSVDSIWSRNLDKKVQTSLNYYLRKAGLPKRKITATI